jgi:hypothetical protein
VKYHGSELPKFDWLYTYFNLSSELLALILASD